MWQCGNFGLVGPEKPRDRGYWLAADDVDRALRKAGWCSRWTAREQGAAMKRRLKDTPGSNLPAFVAPQLATLVDAPPEGDDWVRETKFDGYRAFAGIGDGRARIWTRSGLDRMEKFASLVAPLGALPCRSALLDGEIVVRTHGRTDFGALQNALSTGKGSLIYQV